MTELELGPIGVTLSFGDWTALLRTVPELERLGYATIWVSGGQINNLDQINDVVRSTRKVPIGTGIIPVDQFPADTVATAYAKIESAHPGRLIVGLGGAHGPNPLRTLGDYLDQLDHLPPSVPPTARVLAALGTRMLELARDRAAGALPLLVPPGYTKGTRDLLGLGPTLIIQQCVVLEADPGRAREVARGLLRPMSEMAAWSRHFQRLGFSREEIAQLGDRFVDALVSWGDLDTIAERISEHLAAGADQVALTVLDGDGQEAVPVGQMRQLARALIT